MSNEILEERVGKLETGQARQEERLGRIENDVAKAATGIEKLLDREARRPEALSWTKIAGTALTTLSIVAGLVWLGAGLIAFSPEVVSLKQRLDHAEWKYGWVGRIERSDR